MSSPILEDKRALSGSQAGMRFIAQMKIYNDGDFDRLAQFISESYGDALLAQQPTETRLQEWRDKFTTLGRHKVKQVLAAGKHQVSIIVTTEHTPDFYYVEVQVEEDYPHKILTFLHAPLGALEE
jgi:hypothetical protein